MSKLFFFVIVVLIILQSCQQEKKNGKLLDEIPFEFTNDKIILKVKINDKGPFDFIFDSGGTFDLLDSSVAVSIGIKTSASRNYLHTATGFQKVGCGFTNAEFGISRKVKYTAEACQIINFQNKKMKFAGILGHNLFKNNIIEVDMSK